MFCKKCGKQIDADSEFCKFCGGNLTNNSESNSNDFKCSNCGYYISRDADKCSNCGALFQEPGIIDNGLPICPRCGNKIRGNFCGSCGYKMFNNKSNETLYMCLGILGFVLTVIGCCAPFATASLGFFSKSVNYISGDGVIVLVLSLIGLVFLLLKCGGVCLFFNFASLVITIIDAVNVSERSFENEYVTAGLDYGFYLILIGLILTMVMCFFVSYRRR